MGPFLVEPLLEELQTAADSPAPLHDARRLLEARQGWEGELGGRIRAGRPACSPCGSPCTHVCMTLLAGLPHQA